jgi:hypothetical protein
MKAYRATNNMPAPCHGVVGGVVEIPPGTPDGDDTDLHPGFCVPNFYF